MARGRHQQDPGGNHNVGWQFLHMQGRENVFTGDATPSALPRFPFFLHQFRVSTTFAIKPTWLGLRPRSLRHPTSEPLRCRFQQSQECTSPRGAKIHNPFRTVAEVCVPHTETKERDSWPTANARRSRVEVGVI